ncbi:MAG: ATPase, partial [Bacteroidia bacterium]|nr:ATPase [Bacteroidia bacterium]
MAKFKYTEEFEINTSAKAIYPYLVNPNNLAEWFADEVSNDLNKRFVFRWNN